MGCCVNKHEEPAAVQSGQGRPTGTGHGNQHLPSATPAADATTTDREEPNGTGPPPQGLTKRLSDYTHGKVWPGTYNLVRDEAAIVSADDAWHRDRHSASGRKELTWVAARDGAVRYDSECKLGVGAQGGVYKCKEVPGGGYVAVKSFEKRGLAEEQKNNCLHNPAIWHEFQLLRRVGHHPGIVQCTGKVLESPTHFYVPMEYVDGIDLHHRLWPSKRKKHPHQDIALDPRSVFRDVMDALAFCHAHKVAHRDLKPTNVMLTLGEDGETVVKLMDFGLGAEVPEYEGKPVQLRRPVGTTAWCAPEVLALHGRLCQEGGLGPNGKAGTDWQDKHGLLYSAEPADVWSSGVMFWELMTSDHLFHRPSITDPSQRGRRELQLVRAWKGIPQSLEPQQQSSWHALEEGPQELLAAILVLDPGMRPSAAEVLSCSWLKAHSPRRLSSAGALAVDARLDP